MDRLEMQKESIDITLKIIREGFKIFKKENPEEFKKIEGIMHRKNVPGFILKSLERKKYTISNEITKQDLIKQTGLNKGQIDFLMKKKGMTISEIRSLV